MTRKLILGLLAVTLLGIGLYMQLRPSGPRSPVDAEYAAGAYPVVISDLCEVRTLLADGQRTDAYNLFYTGAHGTLHALSADVDSRSADGRTLGGALRKSKARVEAALLNPSIDIAGPMGTLISTTGQALEFIGADVPTTCG